MTPKTMSPDETAAKLPKFSSRIIDDPLNWQAIADRWDDSFPSPMQSYAWLSAWWRHFKSESNAKLAILAVESNQVDVAFAPLYVERTKFGNTVRLLGSGEVCSDYLDFGFDARLPDSQKTAALSNFTQLLQSAGFVKKYGPIDCIELEGFSENQIAMRMLADIFVTNGWNAETVSLEGCWPTNFANTWGEYELKLSKSRRRKVRKAFKWLESHEVNWEKIQSPEGLNEIWPDVVRLHTQRRGMLGQEGCFSTDDFQGFLFEALQQLMQTHSAFVAALHDQTDKSKVIAILVVLTTPDCWQVYQSGADPEAMDREPGHTLNAIVLKDAFDLGVKEVDFLRGDEPYKEGWYTQREPLFRTRLFATHLGARLRFQALRAHRQWKSWTERIQGAFRGRD